MTLRLCAVLEACADPDDQDVVAGVVASVLAGLPADVVAAKHEREMRANGLCRCRVLRKLQIKDLESLGISLGDSIMILEVLQVEPAPPPATPQPAPAPAVGTVVSGRRPELRAFPKLGLTKYPELLPWELELFQYL